MPDVAPSHVARQMARVEQQQRERLRLGHHQPVVALLQGKRTRQVMLSRARREVRRWHRQKLCSTDYVQAWSRLLSGPLSALLALLREDSAEGRRLRQNSPFWLFNRRF